MKKIIITFIIVLGAFGLGYKAYADEPTEEIPVETTEDNTQEDEVIAEEDTKDSIKEAIDFYVKQAITFASALGGSTLGMVVILKLIKKVLKELKEGTINVSQAKDELIKEKQTFIEAKEKYDEAVNILKETIKNQEQLQKVENALESYREAFRLMVDNDTSLVASGTAKKISEVLKKED